MSGEKQTELSFSLGFCLCLTPFCFFFVLKNSPFLNYYKHTDNMMQPAVVLSNVLYCICLKHNTKVHCFALFLAVLLLCLVANRMQVLEYFLFCTGFLLFTLSTKLVLWSNYNVVDPSSVFSYHRY